ncbi:MAG: flagellar hook-length control protein FliK [Lachnospiraceae bacterium]|nr:flagellar hook-length control protein FliK [Lachnospiraceae bacterium]
MTTINQFKTLIQTQGTQMDIQGTISSSPRKEDDSFGKLMNEAAGKNANTGRENVSDIRQSKPAEINKQSLRDSKDQGNRIQDDKKNTGEKAESIEKKPEGQEDVKAKINDKAEDVKEAIKDELSVTDEEIEEAMAELGIADVSLLDPDSLKQLMLKLSGQEDPMALVTNESLFTAVNNVMEVLNEGVEALNEEFGITGEEFPDILKGMVNDTEAFDAAPENKDMIPKDMEEEVPEVLFGKEYAASERGEETENVRSLENNPVRETLSGNEDQKTENTGESKDIPDIKATTVVKSEGTSPGESDSGNTSQNNEADLANTAQPQIVMTTEVGSDGMLVQTVREFSSYTDGNSIMSQVTEQIKVDITPETTTMEMQLHPASLGAVNIQIAAENGVMRAHILVQNEQVREVLATQMEQLLKTFEEQGQKVEEIDVSVANYNLENGMQQNGRNDDQTKESMSGRRNRNLNLNAMSDEDISELDEAERIEAEMMNLDGSSVLYRA